MSNVVIGFSAPKGFMLGAEFIKLWQGRTEYSHVYIKLYSSYTGHTLVYQASHGMVNCMTYETFCTINIPIKEFSVEISPERLRDTVKTCQRLLGISYGYIGLIKLGLSRIIESMVKKLSKSLKRQDVGDYIIAKLNSWGDGSRTFHCSEFAAVIMPEIAEKLSLPLDRIEPVHIYEVLNG